MEKIITIGEKEVRINNNVAWTMEYREQFGEDILPAIMPLFSTFVETLTAIVGESITEGELGKKTLSINAVVGALEGRTLDIFLPLYQSEFTKLGLNVIWSMAKAADQTIAPPKEWFNEFETFPLDEVLPQVYKVMAAGVVSSKNLERLTNLIEEIKKSQPLR